MRVSLWSADRDFLRFVDITDRAKLPQTLIVDGTVFLRSEATFEGDTDYFESQGVFECQTKQTPEIDVARAFRKPIVAVARSTRWFNGTTGEATLALRTEIDVPWGTKFSLLFDETRTIRINGVWCPDIPLRVHSEDRQQSLMGRSAVNKFCNQFRPPKSKLILTMRGLDFSGRLICDIVKTIPALGKIPEERLSLTKHLLEQGFHQAAIWRHK